MATNRLVPSAPVHPSLAFDSEPDFDANLIPKGVLQWQDALGKVALVGFSNQLHQLMRAFDPSVITESPGPYTHRIASNVFGRYIVARRAVLMDPTQRGICIASNDAIGQIFGVDRFPWNDMHKHLRRHMILLDITN